jgi:GMP synthase-like glutamine amidotransferase
LSEFIKYVYENHKHIKLIGCQFGSLLIAYALGGKIREKNNSDVGNYIGKEEVNLRKHFFNNTWVEEIIEYDELQDGEQEEI